MDINEKNKEAIWKMTPSGGFGMVLEIPVTVLSISDNFANIKINKTEEEKTVLLDSLEF
tara:strand:- start:12197 stop:12373 length:177 start_codon:yes stop_codon:yes gene_type:complete